MVLGPEARLSRRAGTCHTSFMLSCSVWVPLVSAIRCNGPTCMRGFLSVRMQADAKPNVSLLDQSGARLPFGFAFMQWLQVCSVLLPPRVINEVSSLPLHHGEQKTTSSFTWLTLQCAVEHRACPHH